MSKEEKTEKEEFDISEPRSGYGLLAEITLYLHPLAAPDIIDNDGYVEIGNINGDKPNTVLIENTCTFTEQDASYYKLAASDIDKIRIKKCINSDMCNIILHSKTGNDIKYLMKAHMHITILKNTVIINTHKYWTAVRADFSYKCILDYL